MAKESIVLDVQYSVYHGVRGKALTKRDMAMWEMQRFYDFIEFASCFMEDLYGQGEIKTHITKAKVKALEKKCLPVDYHPFQEFLYRIDTFTTTEGFEEVTFLRKFNMTHQDTQQRCASCFQPCHLVCSRNGSDGHL